jgi:8-oxo-dGTP diphosphatase
LPEAGLRPVGQAGQLIHVVAGVLADSRGRVLIAQRPPGKHLAGSWEFPGGKRDDDETPDAALRRELIEELGVRIAGARPLIRYRHDYDDRSVDLDVWTVDSWDGEPVGLEGQALDWVPPAQLEAHDLLPADRPISVALQLPEHYLITGGSAGEDDFRRRLGCALDAGIRLVQLRLPDASDEEVSARAVIAAGMCRARHARLLINGEPAAATVVAEEVGADGIHVPSRYLRVLDRSALPADMLCGVSCHDRREVELAIHAGADFAVLGPVRPTPSHAGAPGIGWVGLGDILADLPIPVYALGGVGPADVDDARRAGAQGVAGISAFW